MKHGSTRGGRVAAALLVAFVLVAAGTATLVAAHGDNYGNFPVQSYGNRGEDVRTIQWLLTDWGYSLGVDGIYGTGTKSTVEQFQADHGLGVDGITGQNTWSELVITYSYGESGNGVKAIQNALNHKYYGYANLAVDGIYGSGTKSAVEDFQSHMGLSVDGITGPNTWKYLTWHYERPNYALSGLCLGYSDSGENWGTSALIGQTEAAAQRTYNQGWGPVAANEISVEHGGPTSGHNSHQDGLDIDLRPMRDDDLQCDYGTKWQYASYDRDATRALIDNIVDTAPGHVKFIIFNDPELQGYRGVVIDDDNGVHDDHLHVRYCEALHPDSKYVC